MTGQDKIIALRRAGRTPRYVWVSDFAHATLDGRTVCMAGDTPELEDFRFLVGLTAIVEGSDPIRVDRIANACAPIARRVIASTHDINRREVVRVTDTEGILNHG